MSSRFRIAETEGFRKKICKSEYRRLYGKITEYVYPILRRNPYYGPNIKRLKGDYSQFLRYRIGDYRLFYTVHDEQVIIFIIDIVHRKDAYK